MAGAERMENVTLASLQDGKARGEKFACITAYDATFARLVCEAGAEVILVGDSLGMVLQGHDSTVPVRIDDMSYHTRCVARGNRGSLILADMPFMACATPARALDDATSLMQAGAHAVKVEGGAWLGETIRMLVERGIPVCAHLGLTPQSINLFGGFLVQGRAPGAARSILADAVAIQDAGASLLLLECVPRALAADISRRLRIPVIGIGAGAGTDAQVLVLHDLLGLGERRPRFVENFMAGADSIQAALESFVAAVKSGEYPRPEHSYE